MSYASHLIKRLFPHKIITHHISDLNNEALTINHEANDIYISIEKENGSRQFCSLSIEELIMLYEHCPIENRTLYECVSQRKPVKTYIDFEYFIDKNLDIQNHYIGPMSCLKILYYFLNAPDTTIHTPEDYIESALKQFLVLKASTSEKISYHFIQANPSALLENASTLGIFIKAVIHFLLVSVAEHKCARFNISIPIQACTVKNLICLLAPYVQTLRKHCTSCKTFMPYITIADVAYLLVKSRRNEWTTAIDMNVYLKNQQFRLFNSVKYRKNNPFVLSTVFPFDNQTQHSFNDLLRKSLVSFIEHDQYLKICFQNEKLRIDITSTSKSTTITSEFSENIELINKHTHDSCTTNSCPTINSNRRWLHSLRMNQRNNPDLSIPDIQTFLTFVEKLIISDSSHQGYIHSCVRGTYNRNILFFNIGGNYRYCPKKNGHHRRNTVAIMIDTKHYTYSIRCKDIECHNNILSWKKIY